VAIRRGHSDDLARVVVVLGDGRAFTNRGPLVELAAEADVGVTSITAGTGLSGGTITSSGTIAIDTATTVDKTTAQTLTNKTMSGASNTFSAIPQSALGTFKPVLSIVDLALAGATITDGAGSYTYGDTIVPTKTGLVLTGIRVYWPGGHGALTYKLGLWNAAGSLVTSVNVSINAAGEYTGTFASPQTLTAFAFYRISAWETSGARNIYLTAANISSFTSTTFVIANINSQNNWPGYFRLSSCYAAGDAAPTSADATLIAGLVEPVFQ
jgi:hypothetical protein